MNLFSLPKLDILLLRKFLRLNKRKVFKLKLSQASKTIIIGNNLN